MVRIEPPEVNYWIKAVRKSGHEVEEVKITHTPAGRVEDMDRPEVERKDKAEVIEDIEVRGATVEVGYLIEHHSREDEWKRGGEVRVVDGQWLRIDDKGAESDHLGDLQEY